MFFLFPKNQMIFWKPFLTEQKTKNAKAAANIEFTALFAFFVFCSVEVPSYIFLHKKTKFRTFLNSLQRVEKVFSTRCSRCEKSHLLLFCFIQILHKSFYNECTFLALLIGKCKQNNSQCKYNHPTVNAQRNMLVP